ncbi:MAG: nucleotidyltransferase substrate binding protein [Deltaproteobacteria bacterium]|nr:nucleotidyltransferase substrate binding protein [Deltaproteobacteria bacterium]MBI4224622.1 nucleotidyltransferase substrate binding protein [Deltaproteobacteria bacterium]
MKKLKESIDALEYALSFLDKAKKDDFYFSGIAKKFETCFEYTWKYFKQKATEEGLDAYSPKEAIKLAGRSGLIENVEKWLDFLEDRNAGVHDYFGLSQDDYLKTIQEFFKEVKKIQA